jgi:hypothetical protein
VKELVESKGARLVYLPPYSPDLSPIELYWSKFKQFLKKAKARTKENLHQAISNAINTITKEDAKAWFGIAAMLSNKSGNAIKPLKMWQDVGNLQLVGFMDLSYICWLMTEVKFSLFVLHVVMLMTEHLSPVC